jgi:ketosteroid isomerase-like protein
MAAEKPHDPTRVAEAFSRHRFADVYDRLSRQVQWISPGGETLTGKEAVIAACDSSSAELSQLARTEFSRFVAVGDDRVAAVDAVGHYVSHDGTTSVVSSADIYEFDADGLITTITSYAVELAAED